MSEVVHYVLSDVFRFMGAIIIVALFFDGLASVVVATRGGQPNSVLSRIFGGSSQGPNAPQHEP